jgi:hypothetical protein
MHSGSETQALVQVWVQLAGAVPPLEGCIVENGGGGGGGGGGVGLGGGGEGGGGLIDGPIDEVMHVE